MTETASAGTDRAFATSPRRAVMEDTDLLQAAGRLSRALARANPRIYWADLLVTAMVAYGAFAGLLLLPFGWGSAGLGAIAVLAFYRGISFIHELTHIKSGSLPWFKTGWNVLFGIPLLVPSFLYEGVHTLHHARTSYGTERDPEYLFLTSRGPSTLVIFVAAAAMLPFGLLARFAILAPAGVFSVRVRRLVVARWSALATNPAFRRRQPVGAFRREWIALEAAASCWALLAISTIIAGGFGVRVVIVAMAVVSGVAVLNQARTLVAHVWENDSGSPMSLTEQYLDSVNIPPPALLPALWAPVGLRYHGLHHLLPSVPYHALGEAHRRLSACVTRSSSFHFANHRGMGAVFARIASRRDSAISPPAT